MSAFVWSVFSARYTALRVAFSGLTTLFGDSVCSPSRFIPFSRTHRRQIALVERLRLVFPSPKPIVRQRISFCVIDKCPPHNLCAHIVAQKISH